MGASGSAGSRRSPDVGVLQVTERWRSFSRHCLSWFALASCRVDCDSCGLVPFGAVGNGFGKAAGRDVGRGKDGNLMSKTSHQQCCKKLNHSTNLESLYISIISPPPPYTLQSNFSELEKNLVFASSAHTPLHVS